MSAVPSCFCLERLTEPLRASDGQHDADCEGRSHERADHPVTVGGCAHLAVAPDAVAGEPHEQGEGEGQPGIHGRILASHPPVPVAVAPELAADELRATFARMAPEQEAALADLEAISERRSQNEEDEREAVLRARRLGLSWRAIAAALHRDVAGVFQKYRDEL